MNNSSLYDLRDGREMKEADNRGDLVSFVRTLYKQGIPEEQMSNSVNRFLEHKAREARIPLIGTFELTPFCNLDCKMCYVHLAEGQFGTNELLDVDTWKDFVQQAYKAGMRQAKLTGGECLTYPGFEELYLYLEEKKIRINLASNGILLDEKRIDFFRQHPPKAIQVSLYGGSEDTYEAVTGYRCFELVYKNLIELSKSNLPVTIAITPNRYMVKDMDRIFDVADSLNIPYRVNSFLLNPRDNTERQLEELSNEEYISIFKKWNVRKNNKLMPIEWEELPSENQDGDVRYGIQCGAGRSSFSILYDGKMCPCVSLPELAVDTCKKGFYNAWKSIVDFADKYQVPAECGECLYRRTCLICPAAHKNSGRVGHCDTRICEQTKGYISAGIVPYLPAEARKE